MIVIRGIYASLVGAGDSLKMVGGDVLERSPFAMIEGVFHISLQLCIICLSLPTF
jgi:hypothetical protein